MPAGFGLVVNERNEILLIQRAYGKEKYDWSLPGGNKDKGESLRRTAVRETQEETGIKMSSDCLYRKGSRYNFEVWRGKRIGGRLKIQQKECLDAKWFQTDMLPHDENLAFSPDKIVIGKWADENHGSRRVHYPRSVMRRAGFALVVNDRGEVLLTRRRTGKRAGKWSIPGGIVKNGQGRLDAAIEETWKETGIVFDATNLYYENRHGARIWRGSPNLREGKQFNGRWFPLDGLPDDDCLAFAIDVRTIDRWASENQRSRRIHNP